VNYFNYPNMADIAINKSNAKRYLNGSIPPSSPNTIDGEPVPPSSIVGSGEWVPYLGAKDNVDLGVYHLKASHLKLKTDLATIPTDQGSIYWDEDEETIAVILNGSTTKVGEDIFFQVKNQSGATIPKGTAVRFDGVVGASGRINIVPFLANGSNPSIYFLGVTYEAIADGADGKALFNGKIRGVDTSAFSVGDILYASPTVAGGFTTTKPVAPNNIISVAAVLSSGANGILLIRPQIGSNINNDEGVKITTPTTGDILQLQASGLWENKPLDGLGYLPLTGGTVTGTLFFDGSGNTQPRIASVFTGGVNTLLTPVLRLYGSSDISSRYIELFGSNATTNRAIQFPDKTGTVALTSDIPWLNNANGINYNGGNVGIGTSIPSELLSIQKNQNATTRFLVSNTDTTNTSSRAAIRAVSNDIIFEAVSINNVGVYVGSISNHPLSLMTNGNEKIQITATGNILINTPTDAGFRLDVNGTGRFTGNLTANSFITSSDKRKKDIISQDGDLAIYKFKGDSQIHYGYIAQDMEALYPNQVITDNDGMLSLNYIEILVKKVHDLEKEIKLLKNH
jgi:hypothetical protein